MNPVIFSIWLLLNINNNDSHLCHYHWNWLIIQSGNQHSLLWWWWWWMQHKWAYQWKESNSILILHVKNGHCPAKRIRMIVLVDCCWVDIKQDSSLISLLSSSVVIIHFIIFPFFSWNYCENGRGKEKTRQTLCDSGSFRKEPDMNWD